MTCFEPPNDMSDLTVLVQVKKQITVSVCLCQSTILERTGVKLFPVHQKLHSGLINRPPGYKTFPMANQLRMNFFPANKY